MEADLKQAIARLHMVNYINMHCPALFDTALNTMTMFSPYLLITVLNCTALFGSNFATLLGSALNAKLCWALHCMALHCTELQGDIW